MKQRLTLLALILILSISGFSQLFKIGNVDVGFLYIGPKIGLGGAWMSNSTSSGSESNVLFNYQLGAVSKFGITDRLSIQPELVFTRKGSKSSSNTGNFEVESKNLTSYLGIPILAKFSFIKIGNIKIHASGGIYNNVTLSNKVKSESTFTDTISNETYNESYTETIESDNYRTVDFGVSIGGGFEYDMDYGILVVELQIDHGLTDLYKNNYQDESQRNTTVGLTGSFLFDFGDISRKVFGKNKGDS